MSGPLILGVRHHSPACARLVAERIRALRPAHVLIEGPADFNDRLDELFLPHRLPVAIYSHLSGAAVHRGSWSPFAEHSPEWQALQVGREVGARLCFIDLPAWHDAFSSTANRYADAPDAESECRAEAYERTLSDALAVQGRDALWDHLFEDDCSSDELSQRLNTYFEHLRPADDPGSVGNQAREQMMARWIAWALHQAGSKGGAVVVVCGGYHAPALARLWPQWMADACMSPPPIPEPSATVPAGDSAPLRYGSYLVPYTFKRLDALAGYASGMPSPGWYQWLWESGLDGAAHQALQQVMLRLRRKKLPASTADLMGVVLRAQGLARLRGHGQALRCDWLDALAGALVKEALDTPLPWTYRGPIRPGTDPVLVQVMDVLAGDAVGLLAPGTPQPPLVHSVRAELQALGIALQGTLKLDLLCDVDRQRSRVLHRLALLGLPGVVRSAGPRRAMSAEHDELWTLSQPLEQQAALIEAGSWGATLIDAARARLEDELRRAQGRIAVLADGLNRAACAALPDVSSALLQEMQQALANEPHFEALAPALDTLHTLLRHGQVLGMADAPVLRVLVESGWDRALWLLEPAAAVSAAHVSDHLDGMRALRRIAADYLADLEEGLPACLTLEPTRAMAVWRRKATDGASAPVSRGAAVGAAFSLAGRVGLSDETALGVADAIGLLQALSADAMGDALCGLLALARETLLSEPAFAAGVDRMVQSLDNAEFVLAMPALRGALAWLPPQERAALADQVLALHDAQHLHRRSLTARLDEDQSALMAQGALAEAAALATLACWGIGLDEGER